MHLMFVSPPLVWILKHSIQTKHSSHFTSPRVIPNHFDIKLNTSLLLRIDSKVLWVHPWFSILFCIHLLSFVSYAALALFLNWRNPYEPCMRQWCFASCLYILFLCLSVASCELSYVVVHVFSHSLAVLRRVYLCQTFFAVFMFWNS